MTRRPTASLSEEEISRYIPLDVRRDLILNVVGGEDGITSAQELEDLSRFQALETNRVLPTPRPEVPPMLRPFIWLIVPGAEETGDDRGVTGTFEVPYTLENVLAHGDRASLNLLSVSIAELTEVQLVEYGAFLGQYSHHVLGLIGHAEHSKACWQKWVDSLTGLLQLHYADGTSEARRKQLAKADPFVVQMEDQVRSLSSLIHACRSLITSIDKRLEIAKIDHRRREREFYLDRFSHGGTGRSMPSNPFTPAPSPPSRRPR